MHNTLSLLAILLTFTSFTLAQVKPANETFMMAIDVNAGSSSNPCSSPLGFNITVNMSETISVPGFGYHCYQGGIDFQQIPDGGFTCVTRIDNQDSLPAGVTNLGGPDGHQDNGHWQCAVSGWPTANCSGSNQMATYDVNKNTYAWAQGGVQSFEVQCQSTEQTAAS